MSFFDRLLGRNLSRNWTQKIDRLEFDLDRLTLNGVKPGDRFDAFHFLGPADEHHADTDQYRWFSLGLAVVPARDLVSQIYLVWRGFTGFGTWADEVGLGYEPFGDQWTCSHRGQQISLSQKVGHEDLDELLDVKGVIGGEGPKSDVDDHITGAEYNGKDLCYSFDDEARYHCNQFHVSWDENDRLCLVRIA